MNHLLYNISIIMLLIGILMLTYYLTKAYNNNNQITDNDINDNDNDNTITPLDDMYNIVKSMYDNNLLEPLNSYYDELTSEVVQKLGDPMNQEDTVITLGTEQVWIAKRHIFDRLSQIIFHYGLWDSGKDYTFNSETAFHIYCTKNGIRHIGIQEKVWNVYYPLPLHDTHCLFGIAG